MRDLFAVLALVVVSAPQKTVGRQTPEACFVAAIAVVVDDVKDVKDLKYHRMVVAGIRKLAPSPDASDESCEPRDGTVPGVLRQAAESRLAGAMLTPSQVQLTYTIRHSTVDVVRAEIKRFALVARQHSGTFTRVEMVPVDTPDAPKSGEIALPRLAASEAEAASCSNENTQLEHAGATYRWLC